MARTATQVQIGEIIGKARIEKRIGSGSMGDVYLGTHVESNLPVAIKVLHDDLTDNQKAKDRFIRECQLQAALHHPNIIRVFEFSGEEDELPYLVMEYVDGVNLRDLADREVFSEEKGLKVLWDITQALKYIHAQNLIHRDIKPSNVMIRKSDSRALLMDFGLVRPEGSKMTMAGTIMGTANYMPPEQASPKGKFGDISHKSDLYALGATFYRLITGQPPFSAKSPVETMLHVIKSKVKAPREVRPEISPEVEDLCLWCLEKSQEDRPESADALLDAMLKISQKTYKIRLPKPVDTSGASQDAIKSDPPKSKTSKKAASSRGAATSPKAAQPAATEAAVNKPAPKTSKSGRDSSELQGKDAPRNKTPVESDSVRSALKAKAKTAMSGELRVAKPTPAKVKGDAAGQDSAPVAKAKSRPPAEADAPVSPVIWVLAGVAFAGICAVLIFLIIGG